MANLMISKFTDKYGDLERSISQFANIPIQLAFYGPKEFFNYDHKRLQGLCNENNMPVLSVHAPTIDIFQEKEFFKMLQLIKDSYGVDNVTVHPSAGDPLKAFKLYKKNEQRLQDLEMFILYENFDSTKKNKHWLPCAKNIFTAPISNLYMTYDTSHVKVGTDIVQDLDNYFPRLGMVHLSNKTREQNHRPIFDGDHDLKPVINYLKNVPSFVVLEYHNDDAALIRDYNYLQDFFKAS